MTDTKTTAITLEPSEEGAKVIDNIRNGIDHLIKGLDFIDEANKSLKDNPAIAAVTEAVDPTDEPEAEVAADAPTHDELKAKLRVLLDSLIDDAMNFSDIREQLPELLRAYREFDYDSPSLFR